MIWEITLFMMISPYSSGYKQRLNDPSKICDGEHSGKGSGWDRFKQLMKMENNLLQKKWMVRGQK